MNLNLSTSDWLNAALGVLFLYRGIRDLYNGTGTGWSNEDEKNHFHRPFGILSLLCGALWLVNIFLPKVEPLHSILMVVTLVFCVALLISHLCYTLSRDDKSEDVFIEVICAILVALFGIGFGIFMALQPEDAIALHDRGRYTQTESTEKYIKLTRLEGIGLSVLCAVLLVVLLFAPK